MDDSLRSRHEALDPQVLEGLISSRTMEEIPVTAEDLEALEREAEDCRRSQVVKKKMKAVLRHDRDMDRLIANFIEACPYYEHIEY
jgi:hypothetical protein